MRSVDSFLRDYAQKASSINCCQMAIIEVLLLVQSAACCKRVGEILCSQKDT